MHLPHPLHFDSSISMILRFIFWGPFVMQVQLRFVGIGEKELVISFCAVASELFEKHPAVSVVPLANRMLHETCPIA